MKDALKICQHSCINQAQSYDISPRPLCFWRNTGKTITVEKVGKISNIISHPCLTCQQYWQCCQRWCVEKPPNTSRKVTSCVKRFDGKSVLCPKSPLPDPDNWTQDRCRFHVSKGADSPTDKPSHRTRQSETRIHGDWKQIIRHIQTRTER